MKKTTKYFYLFLPITLCMCVLILQLQACDRNESAEFTENELFIKFKPDISTQSIQSFVSENNLELIREFSQIKVFLFSIKDERDDISVCKELNENPLVEYAELNFTVNKNIIQNDHNTNK